ncbi:MAG: hypothetical protein WA754_18910, partial [Pseudolabrys sp.]
IEPINELGIAAHRIWPRRYGRPFMVKRLSIYNRLPTTDGHEDSPCLREFLTLPQPRDMGAT